MGVENLSFKLEDNVIYDPVLVVSGFNKTLSVTNMGTDTLTDLGLYIDVTSNLGDVNYPSDSPPSTDYQDIITWGENTSRGEEVSGGLRVQLTQNSNSFDGYITRTQGSNLGNKIPIRDLGSNETTDIVLILSAPPSVLTRRLYIDLVVE